MLTTRSKIDIIRYGIKIVPLIILIVGVHSFSWFTDDSETTSLDRTVYRSTLSSGDNCDKIPKSGDLCLFVKTHCNDPDGYIDYLELYYCKMSTMKWLGWIFFVVWILFIFYILGSTAEEFFCPALMRISTKLKLSPNVAGVTFLAIGNGSPDIFSSFAAINNNLFPQALGELMGAGLFVSGVVVGAVALSSTVPVKPPRRPFIRDGLFFLGAVVLIVSTLLDHIVTLVESCLLIAYYVAYVLVVLLGRLIYLKQKRAYELKLNIQGEQILPVEETPDPEQQDEPDENSALLPKQDPTNAMPDPLPPYLPKIGIFDGEKRLTADRTHQRLKLKQWSSRNFKRIYHYKRNVADYFDWAEKDKKDKALFFALFPVIFLRHLTIPYMESNKYLRFLCMVQPLVASMFCLLIFQGYTLYAGLIPVYGIILILGLAIAIAVWFTTESNPQEPPTYYFIYTFLGLLMSVVWIYMAANELVAVLEAVGLILRVSNAIMGLTVLAWGNSVADLISNTIISRKGYPQMALGACYAAPLCNMLLGLGISLTFILIRTGNVFSLEDPSFLPNNVFFAIALLLGSLTISLVTVIICGFTVKKPLGVLLIIIYLVFTVIGVLTEFNVIFKDTNLFWAATANMQ